MAKKKGNAKRAMRSRCSDEKKAFAKNLKRNMTKPEKLLWKELCNKKIGIWVYNQTLCYGYVLDFWVPRVGLAIEVDGPHHKKQKGYDRKRDFLLAKKGIATMRFTTDQVEKNLPAVMALIKNKIKSRLK